MRKYFSGTTAWQHRVHILARFFLAGSSVGQSPLFRAPLCFDSRHQSYLSLITSNVRSGSEAEVQQTRAGCLLLAITGHTAARPFLERVWPQERSLATPGVARAFADLPATCGEAFAEAVDAIERFLVPFDCWSMSDYGLFGEEEGNGEAKLSQINDQQKAEAFLRLLDRTIGTAVAPSSRWTWGTLWNKFVKSLPSSPRRSPSVA